MPCVGYVAFPATGDIRAMTQPVDGLPHPLPTDVLSRLRCAECEAVVQVRDGALVCLDGHITRSMAGFLDASQPGGIDQVTAETLASFGYEWTTFDAIQPEDELFWRRYFADVPLTELKGRVALDAGCGKGRFSYFTAEHVGTLVALDGSSAVHAAARNLSPHPNVVVVKSDIRHAPFADRSFDFIFCLGVLHHLKDPEEGFRELVRMLAPNGLLLLYMYSRPQQRDVRFFGLAAASWLRRTTSNLPRPLLRVMSLPISMLLYAAFVMPGQVGARFGIRRLSDLPLRTYRGRPLRSLWLDTFDRLSAPLERRFVWSEISPWFASAGLHILSVRDDAGIIVLTCGRASQH
jgi:SAM-dependent methyltransferase